uniref:Uncharacterized protein n=1 Tax=Anopheles culicifacies TaxID=139723 RepID=A0A182LU82_9DIPT
MERKQYTKDIDGHKSSGSQENDRRTTLPGCNRYNKRLQFHTHLLLGRILLLLLTTVCGGVVETPRSGASKRAGTGSKMGSGQRRTQLRLFRPTRSARQMLMQMMMVVLMMYASSATASAIVVTGCTLR